MKKECAQGYECDACKPELSLRDWFAGMAMSGMMHEGFIPHEFDKEEGFNYPSAAYQMADAMLKEREK